MSHSDTFQSRELLITSTAVKVFDTMTVSKAAQGTLHIRRRDASGLSRGGMVEVRPMRDGKNSIVLTPKPANRRRAAVIPATSLAVIMGAVWILGYVLECE